MYFPSDHSSECSCMAVFCSKNTVYYTAQGVLTFESLDEI